MATQYTKEREAKLKEKGYKVTHTDISREELLQLRVTHYATEMKYTTKVRGHHIYKVWTRLREVK